MGTTKSRVILIKLPQDFRGCHRRGGESPFYRIRQAGPTSLKRSKRAFAQEQDFEYGFEQDNRHRPGVRPILTQAAVIASIVAGKKRRKWVTGRRNGRKSTRSSL